ncbi:MAG: hypothetical protein ABL893_16100, partial [Hyphomicrobium sp.]
SLGGQMRFAEDHHSMMTEIAANSGPLAAADAQHNSSHVSAGDDLLAHIISLHAELQRVCIFVAVSSQIAGAIGSGRPGVRPRSLITFYPRKSAALMLATARLFGSSQLLHYVQ